MSIRPYSLLVAAVVLGATPLLAQQEGAKAKQGADARPVAASAAVQQSITVPVTGLTQDDASKVQTALTAMTHKMYCCGNCKHAQDEAGNCPSCNKPLKEESMPVLSKATANATSETVTLSLNEGMKVRLSEIERALGTTPAKVEPAKLTLDGTSMLYVEGPPTEEGAKKLEQALQSSKLFEHVNIQHKPESRDYHVVATASDKAPNHAEIRKLVERIGDGFRMTDVGWVAPKRLG